MPQPESFWSGLTKGEIRALVDHFRLADAGVAIRKAEAAGDPVMIDEEYRVARTLDHAQRHPRGCSTPLCGPCAERLDILGTEG